MWLALDAMPDTAVPVQFVKQAGRDEVRLFSRAQIRGHRSALPDAQPSEALPER